MHGRLRVTIAAVRENAVELLRSPDGAPLVLTDAVIDRGQIVSGALVSPEGDEFEIRNGIPRFVESEGYVANFGLQWNRYRAVQTESSILDPLTKRRYDEIGWEPGEIHGKTILEAGCGAGRFTRLLLDDGALVSSIDASSAVDACMRTIGAREDHLLAQAEICAAPFPEASFDIVFCFGVVQHTPDPRQTFFDLLRYLKPGGQLVLDSYRKRRRIDRWGSKYLWRPLTIRMPPDTLRRVVEWYVPRWLPIDRQIARLPFVGSRLVALVPCWNYDGIIEDPDENLAWTVLDTYDALSARYDNPQTLESVRSWFVDAGLVDVEVGPGGNGLVATGRRP
jgi:SAM-dependent methyltransferase